MITTILLIIALICFILAAANAPFGANLTALGAVFVTMALLAGRLALVLVFTLSLFALSGCSVTPQELDSYSRAATGLIDMSVHSYDAYNHVQYQRPYVY